MSVALVTDSTADLPPDLLSRWGVTCLPLSVQFGEESYLDGLDITLPEVIRRVRAGEGIPGTARVTPDTFAQTYRDLLARHEAVISLHISGGLSGTVDGAQLAAREFGGRVTVIDSGTTTLALGLLTLRAAEAAKAGHSAADIVATLDALRPLGVLRFSVESLDYLRQNGRIGGAAGLLGSVLNIKPVLTICEGRIEPAAKVRGVRRATEDMVSAVQDLAGRCGPLQVAYVVTPGGEEHVQQLRAALTERVQPQVQDLGTFMVGSVIGAHVGPGGFGVVALPLSAPPAGDGHGTPQDA